MADNGLKSPLDLRKVQAGGAAGWWRKAGNFINLKGTVPGPYAWKDPFLRESAFLVPHQFASLGNTLKSQRVLGQSFWPVCEVGGGIHVEFHSGDVHGALNKISYTS